MTLAGPQEQLCVRVVVTVPAPARLLGDLNVKFGQRARVGRVIWSGA